MNVTLSPELERFIHTQIASGKFASALEVIEASIQLLEEREQLYKGRFEELRQEVLVGIEQLDRGEYLDGRMVIESLRQKNQEQNQV